MFKVIQIICIQTESIQNTFNNNENTKQNLVALVTGGSSGLGLATAQRFIKNGAKVIICDLPTSNGNEIAKTIGSNAQFLPSDVRSSDEIDNLVNNIEKQHGKLNVLVNCAGIGNAYILYNFLKNRPRKLEDFQSVVQVNIFQRVFKYQSF